MLSRINNWQIAFLCILYSIPVLLTKPHLLNRQYLYVKKVSFSQKNVVKLSSDRLWLNSFSYIGTLSHW